MKQFPSYLILDSVRSCYNVGAIFRTADAVGIQKIFLTGFTPAPVDRFGREVDKIAKTALGAHRDVVWEYQEDVVAVVMKLKTNGVSVLALEQTSSSQSLYEYTVTDQPIALVVGNENVGISEVVLSQADVTVDLPMYGKKESLNVSVSTGIALYELRRQFDTTMR